MIIGISGKIGSGKDTVGRIIQYLIAKNITSVIYIQSLETKYYNPLNIIMDFEGFCNIYSNYWKGNGTDINGWQIKKFAGKLKDCVSIITGISREDLEKEEVKSRSLGEEWNRTQKIVDMYGVSYNSNVLVPTTIRQLLQEFGTEVGRQIHNDVWVNALMVDYDKYTSISEFTNKSWIITDLRFPNELEAIKKRNGITIRLTRGIYSNDSININAHPSETALDNAEFDYVIDNHGSIEELIEKVKEILIKEKII